MSTATRTLSSSSPKIAIVGAGGSGLACARAIQQQQQEQHPTTTINGVVLEQRSGPGGVWRYNKRKTPMYRNLRTNLPKELMAFNEYPFDDEIKESFVTHQQVQKYLESYKDHFQLEQYIQYNTKVEKIEKNTMRKSQILPNCPQWRITTNCNGQTQTNDYDAVCIGNGHYNRPIIPDIPGMGFYQGRSSHAMDYDTNQDWKDQTVLCIGARASGSDIARELSSVCPHVYLSDSTCTQPQTQGNVTLLPRTERVHPDGSFAFANTDLTCQPDAIIYCTGYDYEFPFFVNDCDVDDDDDHDNLLEYGPRQVGPLYEQLWHARYPNLAFVGLPHSVVPFPLFEIQAAALMASWTGNSNELLPNLTDRLAHAADATKGKDAHFLGNAQWDYCRRMAQIAGKGETTEEYWRVNQLLYDDSGNRRKSAFLAGPDEYRNVCYQRHTKSISSFPNAQARMEATTKIIKE